MTDEELKPFIGKNVELTIHNDGKTYKCYLAERETVLHYVFKPLAGHCTIEDTSWLSTTMPAEHITSVKLLKNQNKPLFCEVSEEHPSFYRLPQVEEPHQENAAETILNDLFNHIATFPFIREPERQFFKGILMGMAIVYGVEIKSINQEEQEQ